MILTIGEALIDIKGKNEYVGGCPLNVALALSRLNSSALFVGGISSDDYGKKILNYIIDNCIIFDPCFCSRPEPTMTSVVTVKNSKESYTFNWKNTASMYLENKALEEVLKSNSDVFAVFYGSVLYSDVNACTSILNFLDSHKELVSFFDPNVRTKVIEDKSCYISSLEKAFEISDIVKLSNEDMSVIGMDALQIFNKCKHHLIVTEGKNGATWYSKDFGFDQSVHIDGITVPVVDTIGCGDCFSGAVLHWLDENKKLKMNNLNLTLDEIYQSLFFAVCVSAVNASREGCNPPTMEDLQ